MNILKPKAGQPVKKEVITTPQKDSNKTLALIRDAILREVCQEGLTPVRIILFGSGARGTAMPLSDWDMLVTEKPPLMIKKQMAPVWSAELLSRALPPLRLLRSPTKWRYIQSGAIWHMYRGRHSVERFTKMQDSCQRVDSSGLEGFKEDRICGFGRENLYLAIAGLGMVRFKMC